MATKTILNETATTCYACEKALDVNEGVALDSWMPERFTCATCTAERHGREMRAKEGKRQSSKLLLKLLPAIDKAGEVETVNTSPESYRPTVRVTVNGMTFVVSVESED